MQGYEKERRQYINQNREKVDLSKVLVPRTWF